MKAIPTDAPPHPLAPHSTGSARYRSEHWTRSRSAAAAARGSSAHTNTRVLRCPFPRVPTEPAAKPSERNPSVRGCAGMRQKILYEPQPGAFPQPTKISHAPREPPYPTTPPNQRSGRTPLLSGVPVPPSPTASPRYPPAEPRCAAAAGRERPAPVLSWLPAPLSLPDSPALFRPVGKCKPSRLCVPRSPRTAPFCLPGGRNRLGPWRVPGELFWMCLTRSSTQLFTEAGPLETLLIQE